MSYVLVNFFLKAVASTALPGHYVVTTGMSRLVEGLRRGVAATKIKGGHRRNQEKKIICAIQIGPADRSRDSGLPHPAEVTEQLSVSQTPTARCQRSISLLSSASANR